jgi:hypothetical protein
MKIAVIGSRDDHPTKEFIEDKLLPYITSEIEFVSGGARGVDTIAAEIAAEYGIPMTVFKPRKDIPYPANLFARNDQIIEYCDIVFAFMKKGGSNGTMHGVRYAWRLKKKVHIYYADDDDLLHDSRMATPVVENK